MNFWKQIEGLLRMPEVRAGLMSLIVLVTAILIYNFLRKKMAVLDSGGKGLKAAKFWLGLGIFFATVFVLVRIWIGIVVKPIDGGLPLGPMVEKLLWTFGVGVAIYLLSAGVQHALMRKVSEIEVRHRIRLATSWAGIVVFIIATALIWAKGIGDLGIFLGILGAGLALSLQETLVCIAGWMLFVASRPFDIGDRVEIDNRIGDVISVSVFQTSLLEVGKWVKGEQSTGRMLILPNSMLFRHPIYNYSKGFPFVWDELSIIVTFESDWQEAEKLMLEKAEIEADKIEREVKRQIDIMQSHYAVHYDQLTPIVYTTIADCGVELTLRYLAPVRKRRDTNHRITRNILRVFIDHPSIDFAYNTTRIFRNNEEGKPELINLPPTKPKQ